MTVYSVDTSGFISVLWGYVSVLCLACAMGRPRKHSGTKNTKDVNCVSFWTTLSVKERVHLCSLLFSRYPGVKAATQWFTDLSIQKSHGNCSRGFPPWFYGQNNTAAYSAGQRYLQLLLTCQVQQQQQSSIASAQHSSRVGMFNFMPNLHHYCIFVWSCKLGITRCHLWNRNWCRNLSPAAPEILEFISASCQIFNRDAYKKACLNVT